MIRRIAGWLLVLAAALPISAAPTGVATNSPGRLKPHAPALVWRAKKNRFDARIEKWPLLQTLGRLARVTGWQVFIEPGTESTVSTAFRDLEAREALSRLLGDLNYALLPDRNGASRLFIYRTTVDSATQRIEAGMDDEEASQWILDELILRLKPGSGLKIEDLAKELGATVIGRLDELGAYRLKFESAEAAEAAKKSLEGRDGIAGVENNLRLDRPDTGQQGELSSFPQLSLRPKLVADKDRRIVAVIDTAVQSMGAMQDAFLLKSIPIGSGDPPTGELLHGTSMAETILRGVSFVDKADGGTPVRILPVDVYGSSPTTTAFDVARGVTAAVQNGATVLNLSLGSYEDSPFLHQVLSSVSQQGALVFAAAGNEPVTAATFPAAYPEVVAVTAGNSQGQFAPYANRGQFVDVMAPGTSLVHFGGQPFVVTGTSPATAYVSGIAGGLWGMNGASAEAIRIQILGRLGLGAGGK